jgi:acid phosphatase
MARFSSIVHSYLSMWTIGVIGSSLLGLGVVRALPAGPSAASVAESFGAANSTSGTILVAATGTATGSADLLVAAVHTRGLISPEPVTAIMDSAGNSWVRAAAVSDGDRADGEIWYTSSAHSVTSVTVSVATSSSIAVTVLDIPNATMSPLDRIATMTERGTAASTGSTEATSQADEIAVAVVGWNSTVAASNPSAGFTTISRFQSPVHNDAGGEQAAYETLASVGTPSYSATLSAAVSWTGLIATFEIETSAPPPELTSFSPLSGPVGTSVTINGAGVAGALSVSFNGVDGTITSNTESEVSADVPSGATTGPIAVTTAGGTATTSGLSPSAFSVAAGSGPPHVLVIMEENRGYAATLGSCGSDPYFCSLAGTYASDTSWYGVTHPSVPNYLAMVSGSTQGVTGDCAPNNCGPFAMTSFGGQLTAAGVPWVDYEESMPSPCFTGLSSTHYVEHHNGFMYFDDVRFATNCAQVVLPYPGASAVVSALDGPGAPDFVWITPNLIDDMHSASVSAGDAWLQANLSGILNSSWFADSGTVIITMDENSMQSTPAGGQIPMVIISSHAQGVGAISTPGNHYGTLRSLEDAYGFSYLGAAADPTNGDVSNLFG